MKDTCLKSCTFWESGLLLDYKTLCHHDSWQFLLDLTKEKTCRYELQRLLFHETVESILASWWVFGLEKDTLLLPNINLLPGPECLSRQYGGGSEVLGTQRNPIGKRKGVPKPLLVLRGFCLTYGSSQAPWVNPRILQALAKSSPMEWYS